jgi:membrane-associated protease RseP (regulator of RpoE activity)
MDAEKKRIALQAGLFIATFVTTTIAGAEWRYGYSLYAEGDYTWDQWMTGLPYSMSFLFILSVHEFGHYFTARYHQIKTSLPYYIPLPPFPGLIGTLGALIRIRQKIATTTQNFDVGIAGPLAGFVAAVAVLIFGMVTLPPPEYVFTIHPEYKQFGLNYANVVYAPDYLKANKIMDIVVGKNIMMDLLTFLFADPTRMPNRHELMHYPFLFAGYLSLVFTALNLLPIGQLDGGHVVYGLFGAKGHRWIATVVFVTFVFFAGIGVVRPGMPDDELLLQMPLYAGFLYFTFKGMRLDVKNTIIVSLVVFLVQYLVTMVLPGVTGFNSFLLFAFLLGRFVGVRHPGAEIEEPLTTERKILGWIALAILVLCFTPSPISEG